MERGHTEQPSPSHKERSCLKQVSQGPPHPTQIPTAAFSQRASGHSCQVFFQFPESLEGFQNQKCDKSYKCSKEVGWVKKARLSGSEWPGPDQGRQQPVGVPTGGGGGSRRRCERTPALCG